MKMHRRLMLIATPLMLAFLLLYVLSFIWSVRYSVTESAFSDAYVGLQNYWNVLENKYFRLAVKNTLEFMSVSVPTVVLLSLLLAVQLHALGGRHRLLRGAFILPMLLPSASIVPIFSNLFVSQNGVIHQIMVSWGLSTTQLVRLPVYLLFLWKHCGINIILIMSALMVISKELYEAAAIDGASAAQRFFSITLPSIMPTMYFVFVFSIVKSLGIFKEVYLLYGAYPDSSMYLVQHYMNNHFYKLNYQNLTTGAMIFVVILYLLVLILYRYEKRTGAIT